MKWLGKKKYKQSFIGKLFGKMALKDMMKDEPIKKNLPTVPSFKIKGNGDIAGEKKEVDQAANRISISDEGFIHPFFGKINAEQAGLWRISILIITSGNLIV